MDGQEEEEGVLSAECELCVHARACVCVCIRTCVMSTYVGNGSE